MSVRCIQGGEKWSKSTSFSLKTEWLLGEFEIIGKVEQLSSFSSSLNVKVLLWGLSSVFSQDCDSVLYIFPPMCEAGISTQPLDSGSRLPLLAYRSLSGYQKSEALNFANQNRTFTFPLHVTWSTSLIDTWKVSFTHLIQGNTGNLGLWNVPAALSCLGFSPVGLVRGPV